MVMTFAPQRLYDIDGLTNNHECPVCASHVTLHNDLITYHCPSGHSWSEWAYYNYYYMYGHNFNSVPENYLWLVPNLGLSIPFSLIGLQYGVFR